MLVVVAVLVCHLTMQGEAVDSLYFIYQKSIKTEKTETAEKLFRQLKQVQLNDTLIQCNKSDRPDALDAEVHYWMSVYYLNQGKYEAAIDEGNLSRELMAKIDDPYF